MRNLFWYIRSTFCKHEWEREEGTYRLYSGSSIETGKVIATAIKVSSTCKNCGWHRVYKKF